MDMKRPQCECMNRRRKFLLASVLALQNSSFIYPSCPKCFSRIILDSKRSKCPKCGSTDKAENANYRYKLSLKVTESNKLFIITVFGSCLDAFFGLTATDLHRYIQDPSRIPEILDSNTTQNLLTKAVETCFVGQRLIFGVTKFGTQLGQGSDSSNSLQQCCDHKRETKELVACQVVLPDPRVAGFTVIDYFHQLLQTLNFRKLHGISLSPNSDLFTLDHSDSEFSSIHGSDSTCFFRSCDKEKLSRFWPLSLELTFIGSQQTDSNDLSALEQSKVIGTLHQNENCFSSAEATDSKSCHDPSQGSWSLVSHMDKNSIAEKLDVKYSFQTDQLSGLHSSHHDIGLTDSNFFPLNLQEPPKSNDRESIHSVIEIKNSYTECEIPCYQLNPDILINLQERSVYSPSPFKLEEIASDSQNCDSEIWDNLPLSESLNKFLAIVESETAVTQTDASLRKHNADGINELHADHSRLSVVPQRTTGTLHTPPIALRSSQATVITNSSKDNFLSNCEADPSPNVQKQSQPDSTAEAVSKTSFGRNTSRFFLQNPYQSGFLSAKDSETTLKKTRRDEMLCRPNTSESEHSYLSIEYLNGCEGKSLSEMNEKLTALYSRKYYDVSDLCKVDHKQSYRWPENEGDSFTVCRKLTYSLEIPCSSPNTSTHILKDIPYGHISDDLSQNCSAGHEGVYNTSAELFDDIDKEISVAVKMTKNSQDVLLHLGTSLAERHQVEPDFSVKALSENCSQPSQKLSMQNASACRHPRTCSPPPNFQSDSEKDFEDSQDFVPCSQSTPVAGFQQTRIYGIRKAFQKIPAFYSDLDANKGKTRISFKNDKLKATPGSPQNIKTTIQKSRNPGTSSIAQPEIFNHCPIAESPEADSDEWVPPTTKKVFVSDMLGFQVMSLQKRFAAQNSPDQRELPRKKTKYAKERTDECLMKKLNLKNMFTAVTKQTTPKYNCKSSDQISKELNLGLNSSSEVKHYYPFSENCLSSAPENKYAWSPELFS
ncbi:DNA damage-induced apoptosis suppressor protein [Ochotona princeps]|uniref:DNA damage-induced apoptosis suppressor protein n=1 Tax=Ochotona princeps TaxID=9978 RepID=UPI002715092A|nr:DNA damage-induced apoptosis suppressor protein [Ochotona princeps]